MNTNDVKHLIDWKDWNANEVQKLLFFAKTIKKNPTQYQHKLNQKTLVMLFQKTSTRTRVSFEAGMTELGGHGIFLDWIHSNFKLTKVEYEIKYLSRNAHILMARLLQHETLLNMKKSSQIPLINGCCNLYHPCQAMADMLTILEDKGSIEGANLTYIGVHNNVVNSLLSICSHLKVNLTLVCPIAEEDSIDLTSKQNLQKQGLLTETLDIHEGIKNAEYIYTDTWIDMEFFENPSYQKLKQKRIETMLPYQINKELLQNSNAKIMHDMPIHVGYEISEEMVEHPNSIIYQQAENRLHAQKSILLYLLDSAC